MTMLYDFYNSTKFYFLKTCMISFIFPCKNIYDKIILFYFLSQLCVYLMLDKQTLK